MRTTKETVIHLDDGDTIRVECEKDSFATIKIGGYDLHIQFDPDRSEKPIIEGSLNIDIMLFKDPLHDQQIMEAAPAANAGNEDIRYIDVAVETVFLK